MVSVQKENSALTDMIGSLEKDKDVTVRKMQIKMEEQKTNHEKKISQVDEQKVKEI